MLMHWPVVLLIMQYAVQDEFSVNIFEEVVRFHLLSEHELCEEEASSECKLVWLATAG